MGHPAKRKDFKDDLEKLARGEMPEGLGEPLENPPLPESNTSLSFDDCLKEAKDFTVK